MASTASSPRRLQSQNSVKKQENDVDSPLRPGRQPLRAIPEASLSRSSSVSENTEISSPSKPSTPRGKKRAAAVYRQSENVDGNIGSASNTPEKPREKRTALTRVSKATAPWSSKLPVTASLARALQDSLLQTDAANKSWDSDSVGGTPTTSYRTPLIPSTGVGKPGSIEPTSRSFKISGKPPLDSDPSRTCFGSSNSSFLQSTPSRSVNRSLRYGATPGSAVSVGSSRAPGNGAKSSGSFQFNSGQQISAQQFDFEEDSTFWEDHNVQVILRTRPINASESALKGFSRCIRQENSHSITWIGQPETRFTFDHVAGEHITQENLFRVAGVPMVENCMAGYNSCMFCYGQTGSGKTHTMLGDIVDLEQRPSGDRGITPRVFEYLFSKIQKDEESRTDEHLKYVCKCSFLEIFNEQITDLLEPSSTNLQVREGGNKGVYVENLSEVVVGSVQDVVRLLLLGAANRKVAATNMNRESSRSHSVFTCTIESKWQLNSTTNFRFGRLNLVDLAGSERQKTSGAEGERLKEAANINKSLSTLGLVIMVLVDVANGKQRHVPYRDSKLTYLLQDSLGGNSKTTMIANISPSSCCALETLSTLKFAQRAKFIRNNAVVNEDASGDMNGLRQEIQELKEELNRIRRQDLPRTPSMHSLASVAQDSVRTGDNNLGMAVIAVDEQENSRCSLDAWEFSKAFSGPRFSNKKLEAMEAVLAGALRREQEAELSQKRQSAEIEQLTRLVKQREDDSQCSKMLLRFREDKIRRLEALSAVSMSADIYLRQENDFLMNELRLLQEKADRNTELTRFAMENIRLLEQLRRFQDFYTGGEREAMADEISSLRDQLLEALDSKLSLKALTSPQREALAPELAASQREIELLRIEADNYRREVEDCRKNLSSILEANARITKELDESNAELREVKLKDQVHEVELQKLREKAVDAEAIEWGHEQHLELISNLKLKLQQSEDRADREADLRFDLNERLHASLGETADLHADLQETRGALHAAEMLVCSLQSAESDLSVAQEMAILAQNAVRQMRLETKEIAEDQRLSLKQTEDAVVAACMKELQLREELKEAQFLIQKLSSTKDEPMCPSPSEASKNEREGDILVSKRTAGISQLEQDLVSLDLSFGSGCKHVNTRSRESANEETESIAELCDESLTTQRKQSSYQEQGKDCILKLNFTLEESFTVEDRALSEVEPTETREDPQDAKSIVSDLEGNHGLHVLEGNTVDLELVQAIRRLQAEIMKLKPQGTSDQPRETATKWSSTELVKELQGLVWVVQAVLEERKNLAAQNEALLKENDISTKSREERDAATSKLLEHLNEGEHALTDAVHEMQGILDDCLSQPTALDKGKLQEQESVSVQELNMTVTSHAGNGTDKAGQTGGNEHSVGLTRNFAVCTIMLQWFSDTLSAEASAKSSLRIQNDRAEEDIGNKDFLIKKMEEDVTILQRDWTELESKTVKTQEKLRASNILMKELSRSEEQLKLQTAALAAENKRLTRCMACREMEFSSLQGQIEALENSLKESHEKERICTVTLGNLKESQKVLEKQWHVEREQMKDRIVTANRELSESQEMNRIIDNALKELDGEIIAAEKKCEVTLRELGTQWSIAREEMSSHLIHISLDFKEVTSCTEKMHSDLAKALSSLSAAETAIKQLVDESSELKDTNKQLLAKQEALQSELFCWEQYSVELQRSSCFVPSPCKDSSAIANPGVRPSSYYFETLKTVVENVRRECEGLRAEVFDKDTTLLSVQMELSAGIANSREVEIELACLADERSDLKLQLTSISKALANAQDEVRCRDVELKTFECELHKVMDVLARTEEKMDESSSEWRKHIEKLKAEMEDAKLCASEKSTEAIMLRKKFEDGQTTLKEAEILVNALVRANEIAKLDILKWKSTGEKITLQSSEVLSMIDKEVSVTVDHVEKHLQDLGTDIHGMKSLLTGICSEREAGFYHEFEELLKIQFSEIESATDGAHMKLAKMNAKVTELEQRLQRSVLENEALQASLDRTQDFLVGSQASLEDATQNMEVQQKEYATTKDELVGALTSLAGKSAQILELTFECDHLSTRNQELERLLTETCEELRINVANSEELEMEKLALVEATEMLQVGNNHLGGRVKQLEISLADAMRMKQVVEMEVVSLRHEKDSYEDEIRKFEVDLAASHDAVNAAAAKLLEKEDRVHTLISDLENSHNEVVCIQGSLNESVIEVHDLRLLTHDLGEREVHLKTQAETQKNLLKSTSEKFLQSEAEFHEAVQILATMLESTSSELHAAETLKADLEKNNIKFSSLLSSLQSTASQLGQENGFLSVRVSALEEDKKNLLERLEVLSKQLCMQTLEASAASSAQDLQLEILKTIIESTSMEVQDKDHMLFLLQEKLEQSSSSCLALDEDRKELLGRLEIQGLELCKQSQEASAASTAHHTELEILRTTLESEWQEKHVMVMSLRERLEQSSARCLALDEEKKELLERLETQSLELCEKSQEVSAASTAHQTELEILKTTLESASCELQDKDHLLFLLQKKLEQSSARCLALEEDKKELLERLETQSLELRQQSQEASAASTTHQTELEILKTTLESASFVLQEKSHMIFVLQEKLEQSSARCLALDENINDLLERLESQSLELCQQSQEASAASTAHQIELEFLKIILEGELQEKSHMIFVLQEKLEQSSAGCLALDEDKKELLDRLESQILELCQQSQEASAASTVHQTELEILRTTLESELQEKHVMIMSLRESLEQSIVRCLTLDENKNDLLERLETLSLELCKLSQEASAASTAQEKELEILKTTLESASCELQEKSHMIFVLQEKLEQSSARCLALDEDKKELLDRLESQSLELCQQSEEASAASTAHQTELEILRTTLESGLQEKHVIIMSLRERLEQSSARCLALDEEKKELLERLETRSLELCKKSQEGNAASTAHLIELEILKTIIDSASNELLEKDHITSSLLDKIQESGVETLKLLNSLEISVVASAQMEHERDEIRATASNLETEKKVLRDEINIKSRSCADLELITLRLQTELQESSTASWKLKLELEILTAMLESAVLESREKDAMASDLENLLSQSQLQNAEMLQSSQEVVNHFSLFQSQLDACFQQNKELERNKMVLTAEVSSLSQEIADMKDLRQASEKSLEEFRTSFAQLRKQKDEEVRLLSDEVEKLKAREAAMEVDLWDWEQRCQDTEVQLDEKASELMVLRDKLVATQEECKQQLELVYEALRDCQRRAEEMDSERRDLINEIEEGCFVVADLQAKLQLRESQMEEHFSRHSIEQEALESLENENRELESIVKHLTAEVVANQQRATAAQNMQVETRLEMEALERDLKQKDDLLQNLESDLNLLQESAFQELRLNQELDSLRATSDVLHQDLTMQKERRTRLEIEIGQVTEEIVQTRNQAGTWKAKACELETELDKKRQTIESLEDELRMAEQNMANTLEEVTVDLKDVENERDRLQIEVHELTEHLKMTHTMVEERDAAVSELHQAGELSRTHAKEKEDEAKLLTRSVHELESTVYALENQLGLLKREAERQRLLREDIEMESQKLNNHIFMTQSALEESNTRNAEELKHAISALQEIERKVEDKESEISHLRRKLENLEIASKDKDVQINDAMTQISDLLLAAEVQKADYQKKLKRIESQVERSKAVNWEVQFGCTIAKPIEVATEISSFDANPAQESFSRRDVTHVSCQSRINELEELASSRQKEVSTLHTRLAEAESMTHDVLRDLLGVKSEMNNVVSMLDHQQIKQLAETACRKHEEAEAMETELSSLRSQLNAYIEERESWVEEINRRQCEIVTARVAAENLRQKEQVLTDEIEKFRIENINHQEKITELEMEIRRLPSSQQSFYQQINHHARIKEENQALKLANEELSKELRRTELLHAGMHDELLRYKSAEPKSTAPSFDEERLNLRHLLQEAESSRAEAAQKLSSLCSALMQAAGLSVSETVDVPEAMDALNLLENRLRTTEPELLDFKYKTKFTGERRRRTDARAKDSPLRSISNFTDLLQRASSCSPAPR